MLINSPQASLENNKPFCYTPEMSDGERLHLPNALRETLPSYLQYSTTRRDLAVKCVGFSMVSVSIGGLAFRNKETLFRRREAYSEHKKLIKEYGFPEETMTDTRKEELLGHSKLQEIHLDRTKFPRSTFLQGDDLEDIEFYLPEDAAVIAEVKGNTDENISLWVVEADFRGLLHQLANVQDSRNDSTRQTLGKIPAGNHSMRIRRTAASEGFHEESFNINLSYPKGNSLYTALVEHAPLIGVRKDNYSNGTIINDMPLFLDVHMREREDGLLMVEYWQGYTKEEGGIGADVRDMVTRLDRAYDYDIALILLMDRDANIYRQYYQTDNENGSHQFVEFERNESVGSLPSSPVFHAIGDHGMVENGLGVDDSGKLITRVHGYYPEFYPDKKTRSSAEKERARRVISLRQYHELLTKEIDSRSTPLGGVLPGNGAHVGYLLDQRFFVEAELIKLGYPIDQLSDNSSVRFS